MGRIRVCVVGGGASGLACGRVLSMAEYNCEPTIFEQNTYIGGQWHYDPDGTCETTGVYRNLRTNIKCSVMQFSDFPFVGVAPDSYTDCKTVEDYLHAYAEKHQLLKITCLDTTVNSIDETFTVTYTVKLSSAHALPESVHRKLLEKTDAYAVYSEQFDAVCVANGHYADIYMPENIVGFDTHTFRIMHSRAYRDPEHYRGKCVVVVGASHSGVDICGELTATARQVILSMKAEAEETFRYAIRLLEMSGKTICTDYLSSNFSTALPIERIDGETVYFTDGHSVKPDVVIFATGYLYRMPFLQGKLQVDQTRLLRDYYVYPLYKQFIHADFPDGTLSFLTIPYRVVPFPLAELQSHVVARVLCGMITLPSREEMLHEVDNSPLPRNRAYHCVNMVEYGESLLRMMSESDANFDYKFTIDSQRRIRKVAK